MPGARELFASSGYDEVRMEEVAERAGVSPSTLYRYFQTKDSLVLEPIGLGTQMATFLASRPAEEPVERSLGFAIVSALQSPRGDRARVNAIRQVLRQTPSLRTRLLDALVDERVALEAELARRTGRRAGDVWCATTARVAVMIFELAAQEVASVNGSFDADAFTAAVKRIMNSVRDEPPALPRIT